MTPSRRDVPLGYLRTFLTLVVVAHHAALAYHPFAPPPASSLTARPLLWTAFPVVDAQKWPGAALFVGFNDTFFMSLMFLISGVFAWPSLLRKGSAAFARDRAIKLGVPFVVAAAVLSPLAYYPSYLATGARSGLRPFLTEWLTLGTWPSGPAWFLWVLLAFGLAAALVHHAFPAVGPAWGRLSAGLSGRPGMYALALVAASALAYLPMAAAFSPESWANFGPFWVQSSRLLHYGVYFTAGVGLGACGLDRGLLAYDGRLARRWPFWVLASLTAFVLALVALFAILRTYEGGGSGPSALLSALGNFTYVLSCAASSLALLAVFIRFARVEHPVANHLSTNAYGIYLLHYVCVSFLQFTLLGTEVAGGLKMALVFVGAVGLSWAVTMALRKIPAIRRLI